MSPGRVGVLGLCPWRGGLQGVGALWGLKVRGGSGLSPEDGYR